MEKTFGRKEANETVGNHEDSQDLKVQVSLFDYWELLEAEITLALCSIDGKRNYWYQRKRSIGIIDDGMDKQFGVIIGRPMEW